MAFRSLQAMKIRGKHEKEDKRAEVKRDIPFYLYIVDFLWERKKRLISVFMKMHSYRKQWGTEWALENLLSTDKYWWPFLSELKESRFKTRLKFWGHYRSLHTDVVSLKLKAVEYLKLIKNRISLTRANKSRFIKI